MVEKQNYAPFTKCMHLISVYVTKLRYIVLLGEAFNISLIYYVE